MIEPSMPATKDPPKPRYVELDIEFTCKPINDPRIDRKAEELLRKVESNEFRKWQKRDEKEANRV